MEGSQLKKKIFASQDFGDIKVTVTKTDEGYFLSAFNATTGYTYSPVPILALNGISETKVPVLLTGGMKLTHKANNSIELEIDGFEGLFVLMLEKNQSNTLKSEIATLKGQLAKLEQKHEELRNIVDKLTKKQIWAGQTSPQEWELTQNKKQIYVTKDISGLNLTKTPHVNVSLVASLVVQGYGDLTPDSVLPEPPFLSELSNKSFTVVVNRRDRSYGGNFAEYAQKNGWFLTFEIVYQN